MSVYFITGDPGSGKSTVIEELKSRGYTAYNTDDLPDITKLYDLQTDQPVEQWPSSPIDWTRYRWSWDIPALKKLLAESPNPSFAAAITSNSDDNFHLFKQVFALKVSHDTLKHRVLTRTTNNYGKHPQELAGILKRNAVSGEHWHAKGAIIIDADQPVTKVVDGILSHIDNVERIA